MSDFPQLSARRYRRRFGLLALAGLSQAVLAGANVWLFGALFGTLFEARGSDGGTSLGSALAVVVTLSAWLRRTERLAAERLAHGYAQDVRVALFSHLCTVDDSRLSDARRGGVLLRFLGDLAPLRQWVTLGVIRGPIALAQLTGALAALAYASAPLAGVVALVLAVPAGLAALSAPRLRRAFAEARSAQAALAGNVAEKLDELATLRAAGREHHELARVARDGERLMERALRVAAPRESMRALAQWAAGAAGVAVLTAGAALVGQGLASAADIVAAVALLALVGPSARDLQRAFEARQSAQVALGRLAALFALERLAPFSAGAPDAAQQGSASALAARAVEVGPLALDLDLAPGELGLFVCADPGLRARALRVLAGLSRPDVGEVLVDGRPAVGLSARERARALGIASDGQLLVRGSVSRNVRYRVRRPSRRALRAACRAAQVNAPLKQRIGPGGAQLEPSERTRIVLARALVAAPTVVILDEHHLPRGGRARRKLLATIRAAHSAVVVAMASAASAARLREDLEQLRTRSRRAAQAAVCCVALALASSTRARPWQDLQEDEPAAEASAAADPTGFEPELSLDGRGLTLRWREPAVRVRLGGRVHLDLAEFSGADAPSDDVAARRARLGLSARYEDWRFFMEQGFGEFDGGPKTALLSYKGFDFGEVRVGQHLLPMGLDQRASSDELALPERPLQSALTPGFMRGIDVVHGHKKGSLQLGLYGDALDGVTSRRAPGTSVFGRATFAPKMRRGHDLHVGASLELRDVDEGARPRFRARPEVRIADTRFIDTGRIDGVSGLETLGLELGYRRGGVLFEADAVLSSVEREGAPDLGFYGTSFQVSTFLSDHRRRYDEPRGRFRTPVLDQGEWAHEVAARVSTLDLDDQDVRGGSQVNWSIGYNLYYGRHTRLMFHLNETDARPGADGVDRDATAFLVRWQLSF